jgi:hypothetical protein
MQINDIRSNLFSDPLPPIFVSICRQSVKRLRPGIVPSIEKLIALTKIKYSLVGTVADVYSHAVEQAVL